MREYERLRTEGKLTELVSGAALLKGDKHVKDDVTTSSAGDVGSESSISDVQVSPVSTLSQKNFFSKISVVLFHIAVFYVLRCASTFVAIK